MTVNSCQACPVCKVICICVSCWFLNPGCAISVKARSMEKHLTARYLTRRTCFREIGKPATAPTNHTLSFSPYLLFLWCVPSAARATFLPQTPLSHLRFWAFLKRWEMFKATCNPGSAHWWEALVLSAALHAQSRVHHKQSKSWSKAVVNYTP